MKTNSPRRGQGQSTSLRGGLCPIETQTYTTIEWGSPDPQELIAQGGFVENEIAAVTYTVDPADLPITLSSFEMVWAIGQIPVSTDVTVLWDFWIWKGTPDAGGLLENFPEPCVSLGGQVPDIELDAVTPAATVFVQIGEPGDEIVLTDDDLAPFGYQFSVGARVLQHNDEPTEDEDCILGGVLPAECAGPNPSSNAFPTTDFTNGAGPAEPDKNWIFVRPNCGLCALPGGWYRFSDMGLFQPSGDWNIRVGYRPADCAPVPGACCVDGECMDNVLPTDCTAMGGDYMGEGVLCADIICPEPTGACCFDGGDGTLTCLPNFTEADCLDQGGAGLLDPVYLGDNTVCGSGACEPATGRCCNTNNGACLDGLTQDGCEGFGPQFIWGGPDTVCDGSCFGVCCLPDGSCDDNGGNGISEEDCLALGGIWDDTTIDCLNADCPDPVGACCLDNGNCVPNITEAECITFWEGTWGGPVSDCLTACADPTGACCISPGVCVDATTEEVCLNFWVGVWTEDALCADICTCPGDANGDLTVDLDDLLAVIGNWGSDGSGGGDVNNDAAVNLDDLLAVIGNWGNDCNP